jgi:hypothetical protein
MRGKCNIQSGEGNMVFVSIWHRPHPVKIQKFTKYGTFIPSMYCESSFVHLPTSTNFDRKSALGL